MTLMSVLRCLLLVLPARCICPDRCGFADTLNDLRRVHLMVAQARDGVWPGVVSVPAMLRTVTIIHLAAVMRIFRVLQNVFHQIDGVVEEKIVPGSTIDMNFAFQFFADLGPISFQDMSEIIVLAPILR